MGWRFACPLFLPFHFSLNWLSSGQTLPRDTTLLRTRVFLQDLLKVRRRELTFTEHPTRATCLGFQIPGCSLLHPTRLLAFTTLPPSAVWAPRGLKHWTGRQKTKDPAGGKSKANKQTPPARSRDPAPPALNLRLQLSRSRAPQPRPGLSSGPAPCPAARAHSLAPFRSASPLIRFRLLRYALRLAPPPTERQHTQARLVVTRGPYSVSLSPSSRHSCFRFLTALWFFHL